MSKSQQNRRHGEVPSGVSDWIKHNRYALEELPEPGSEWKTSDANEFIKDRIRPLSTNGIVKRVDKDPLDDCTVFETNPGPYNRLQRYLEEDITDGYLPCGHDGFSNLGNNEYQCTTDPCSKVWTREEIKKHNE